MKFGDTPLDDAIGAILAHSVRLENRSIKKGTVLGPDEIAQLRDAGRDPVVAAVLELGDASENDAAAKLGAVAAGRNIDVAAPFTGRVNLFATRNGLVRIDRDRLDAFNRVDEAVTLATLPPYAKVRAGDMVATLKIIPYAIPGKALDAALMKLDGRALLNVAAFAPLTADLIQTRLAGTKESVLDKTARVVRERLDELGCELAGESRCAHDVATLAGEIRARADSELLLITGATAIADRRDVIPAALETVGGTVDHFGMPVDPGNLLMLGCFEGTPVLGLPGCARSPKLNGFDWVLQRIVAGLPVGPEDITGMGAGGLLKEILSRPQPRTIDSRETSTGHGELAAVLLAAGQSRRMGARNKLLIEIEGKPMVAHAADTILESGIKTLIVVTGHEADRVRAALPGRGAVFVENPDHAEGLSRSLACGVAAVPATAGAVLVCLGDMPRVTPDHISRLTSAWDPDEGREICVPTYKGKRGNPVLWDRRFIPEMQALAGDVGARHLIGEHADVVCEVEMDDDGIFLDVDVPAAVEALTRPA